MFLTTGQAVLYKFQIVFTMAKKINCELTKLLNGRYVCSSRVTEYLESLYVININDKEQLSRIKLAIKIVFSSQAEALSGYTIAHELFLEDVYKALPNKELISGFLTDSAYSPSQLAIKFI
jgi:hypothetical protein